MERCVVSAKLSKTHSERTELKSRKNYLAKGNERSSASGDMDDIGPVPDGSSAKSMDVLNDNIEVYFKKAQLLVEDE
ncbi:MAG: hypothetical protein IJU76_13275 [Desulfovibrionaceae bacterium]|nr:hypothetical protein [Desulfovibrionaceae bacterium]